MKNFNIKNHIVSLEESCQEKLLEGVSRTFALTIPQLPYQLRYVVANAYLLCRIADTIEDDDALDFSQKEKFHQQFLDVLNKKNSADAFAKNLSPLLSENTLPAEKKLVDNTEKVVRYTHQLNETQRAALQRCVALMVEGMPLFQRHASLGGLENIEALDRYCYYVAGVVGEMLTELFCDYSPKIKKHYDNMMKLSVSFGQGLQMTNILKDQWEDRSRGVSWLPRDLFDRFNIDLKSLSTNVDKDAFNKVIQTLVSIAREHLHDALEYTLLIPKHEKGIRRFCLWAIGLAVMTLRNISRHSFFTTGNEIKVSRKMVKKIIMTTDFANFNDGLLRLLFKWFS